MDENQKLPFDTAYTPASAPESPALPTSKKETRLWWVLLILCVLGADFALYGKFGLGFALVAMGIIFAAWVYLFPKGGKLKLYPTALLILSTVLAGSFFRSDDGFVKFVSLVFLLVCVPLALTLSSGKNRRDPKGLMSLLDSPRALLVLGVGSLPESLRGLRRAEKANGRNSNRWAALAGIGIAVPLVAILLALLSSADAAFEGLLNLVPQLDWGEPVAAILCGCLPAPVLYTMCVALRHSPTAPAASREAKGMNPITVNTVLVFVCAVYLAYLYSQLAYFVGGLSGLLPEEYTLSQYARRGFFEMALLAMVNLGLLAGAVGLSAKQNGRASLTTRILSLFVGIVTLFFVLTASAKMLLYIDSYGLTRLRVLTEVIMVFLALTTIFVSIWLFVPKFAYMKAVLLTALTLCSITAWADVDTFVAKYNVWAYQTGVSKYMDIDHLGDLSQGAIPALEALTDDEDEDIAYMAKYYLRQAAEDMEALDIRALTLSELAARPVLEKYKVPETSVDTPQPKPNDRVDFEAYGSHYRFAAEEILRLTDGGQQWRQLIFSMYSYEALLEDVRTGEQFYCDRVMSSIMEELTAASFPPTAPLATIVVRDGQVHFCDTNDTYALVYSPKKPPTWLGNPSSPEDLTVEALGDGWYHVTK